MTLQVEERQKAKMGCNREKYNELLALTSIAKPITDKKLYNCTFKWIDSHHPK